MGRSRNHKISIRLNDQEFEELNKMVQAINKPKETIIRSLINGFVVRPAPSKELIDITRELRRIGGNINQIAAVANKTGNIDVLLYTENYSELQSEITKIIKLIQDPIEIRERICL